MHTICIDAWNQAGIDETTFTVRTTNGSERDDRQLKIASYCFEPGITKRDLKSYRVVKECSPTLRQQMGDNQTSVIAYTAKPGEMVRLSDNHLEKELSMTLTKGDGKMGDSQTSVVSFAQNSRDEVRVVGDGQIVGALAAQPGMKQTNYLMSKQLVADGLGHRDTTFNNQPNTNTTMKAEVRRLTPTEVQRLQGFDPGHLDVNDQGDSAKYSETGNSWAVPNARFVLKGIHKVDERLTGHKRGFKYGTISSGVEAHTQAVAGLGDTAVFLSEIAPAPCSVLKAHYPSVPNLGDMTLVDYDPEKKVIHNRPYDGYTAPDKKALGFDPYKTPTPVEIPLSYGDVTVVSGGTPCQDLSVAGKRAGAVEGSNTRSSLAFQLPRIGAAVGAKYIVWENVAGAFSSNGGRDFAWLLHRMTEYGYTSLAWRCMDAQYIRTDKHPRGVPQRRRRVWIVGYRGEDWRVPCEALFEPMKALGNEPPKRTVGVGYLPYVDALRQKPSDNEPQKSELEEFQDFVKGANPHIIDLLVTKGVCESVDDRVRELKEKPAESASSEFDLFCMCADAEKHQGRDLRAADLALDLPKEADIRALPQYKVFEFARTVSKKVLYFGDMFKCESTVEDIHPKLLKNIGNAGFLCHGLICTMKMPEWNAGVTAEELAEMPSDLAALYDGDVCGLSDVLEDNPDAKYKLSWRACYGILRRAVNRGKKLPIELGYALVERIIEQAMFVKWTAMYGKATVKKEGDLSERQVAKIAYDDYIEAEWHWADVKEEEQKKSEGDAEDDGFSVDDDNGDDTETEDAEA